MLKEWQFELVVFVSTGAVVIITRGHIFHMIVIDENYLCTCTRTEKNGVSHFLPNGASTNKDIQYYRVARKEAKRREEEDSRKGKNSFSRR